MARKPIRLEAWGRKGILKSAQRRPVPLRIRRAVRSRAGDRCEECRHPLKAVLETEHPEQWTDREVLDIYRDYPCHRCGFRFPVVDAGWLDDDDLGRRIRDHFPAFYKDYSPRLRQSYWANHCPSCGALQGSYRIMETVFDREPDDSLTIAPWRPQKTQERYVQQEFSSGGTSTTSAGTLRTTCQITSCCSASDVTRLDTSREDTGRRGDRGKELRTGSRDFAC